jgi:hypothetical protein
MNRNGLEACALFCLGEWFSAVYFIDIIRSIIDDESFIFCEGCPFRFDVNCAKVDFWSWLNLQNFQSFLRFHNDLRGRSLNLKNAFLWLSIDNHVDFLLELFAFSHSFWVESFLKNLIFDTVNTKMEIRTRVRDIFLVWLVKSSFALLRHFHIDLRLDSFSSMLSSFWKVYSDLSDDFIASLLATSCFLSHLIVKFLK